MKVCEYTGYAIRQDYDLEGLKKYGFRKTEPKDINPWWQRPFDIKWGFFGTWDSELLVSREDRKLLIKCEEKCNLDSLNSLLKEMIRDGVLKKGGE